MILNYDVASTGGPGDNAEYDWYRKQFAKLGVELNIRATLYNRFQDNSAHRRVQIFSWAWHADYPDPENFLFLLYGPNGKVKFGGENAANYANAEADQLYPAIADLPDGADDKEKLTIFCPLYVRMAHGIGDLSGHFRARPVLGRAAKPNAISANTLKYFS